MRISISVAALGIVILGFAAVGRDATAVSGDRSVEAAIDARERALEACFAKADPICEVNSFYVSDANAPLASTSMGQVTGRAALIKLSAGSYDKARTIRLEHSDIIPLGADMANELGRWHLTLKSGQETTGRFSCLWLREADGWRVKINFVAYDD